MSNFGGVIFKDNLDARVAPNSELPPDHPARAAPRPEEPRERIRLYKKVSAETRAQPARIDDVIDAAENVANYTIKFMSEGLGEVLSELVNERIKELVGPLKAKHAELQLENAQQKAAIAEAQVSELSFVSERLRVEKRGPPGMRGERG
jgi:hypothetical protein